MSAYRHLIQTLAPGHDAGQVEAFMRIAHPTLDGLDRETFAEEVAISCEAIDLAGPAEAAALARTFGL